MFLWQPGLPSQFEEQAASRSYRMGAGEFFTRSVAHSFERSNTLGLLAEDTEIMNTEKAAGTYDDMWWIGGLTGTPTTNRHSMSEEDFKAGGYDRGGRIEYVPEMTEQRASILAETFDRREAEARILDRNSDTFGRKALGFGAGLIASLPDPINLIPVGGALSKGASLGTRALKSGVEGIAGTAVTDALLLPEAKRRGEDVGLADFALDVVFGGLIGAGIGGAGGLLHNRRVKGLSNEQRMLTNVLTEGGFETGEAGRLAADTVNTLADMPGRRNLSLVVRKSLAGMDRAGAGKLLERAMLAMRDGEPLDVGKWAKELGADNLFTRAAELPGIRIQEVDALVRSLEEGSFQKVSFGELSDDTLQALNAIRTEEGVELLRDGKLILPANVVKKLHEKRILQDGRSGEDVARLLLDVFHLDPDVASSSRYPHIQALVKLREGLSEIGFIAQDPKGGETVIKSVYLEPAQDVGKRLSKKREKPVREDGAPSISVSDESPLAASRLSDLQTGSMENSLNSNIHRVNDVLEWKRPAPDFTPLSPEPLIAPHGLEDVVRLERETTVSEGGSPLDLEATRLVGEGKASREDFEAVMAAQTEMTRVDKLEEAGLSVLECVLNTLSGGKK